MRARSSASTTAPSKFGTSFTSCTTFLFLKFFMSSLNWCLLLRNCQFVSNATYLPPEFSQRNSSRCLHTKHGHLPAVPSAC
jgi:hypothetical protein